MVSDPILVPLVAGVDEAGRGPLAGPLVVAAVILDPARPIRGINDSKQLDEATRERLYARIVERALAWHAVVVEVAEIDRINIFRATLAGMARAVAGLALVPGEVRVDGTHVPPGLAMPARALIDGDARDRRIGAASIVAKVTRDRLMRAACPDYPVYGFSRHKGYATPEHLLALDRHGPCPLHRASFEPVRRALSRDLFAP